MEIVSGQSGLLILAVPAPLDVTRATQGAAPGAHAYLAAAWTSSPSRPLRRAAKRSDTAGGIVELATDAIRAGGFCGMRFGHVRAWATTDSLKSAPQSWQR